MVILLFGNGKTDVEFPALFSSWFLFGQTLQWFFADVGQYEEAALLREGSSRA